MKPSTQQNCLQRFLKLQPVTGWPEWPAQYSVAGKCKYSLREHTERGASRWFIHGIRHKETAWKRLGELEAHESLCIIEHHLLEWLGEHCDGVNTGGFSDGTWAAATSSLYSGRYDTLIEALLDVAEQIQKEKSDAS